MTFNRMDCLNSYSIINLTPDNIADYGVCGYKDAGKHVELRKKIEWYSEYYQKGLRIKIIWSDQGGYQGMIEYIPGSLAHRPVAAEGYIFIHCIFVGFRKEYKGMGYASSLIESCIEDARKQKTAGVAVVTRKGSFMADKGIFLKKGFEVTDSAEPDFELLVNKFNNNTENPVFLKDKMVRELENYSDGLTVLRSCQCPYTEKNVNAIIKSAKEKFGLETRLVELDSFDAVQASPCAFGVFCIIYKGKIISHHPISNTRFENIMNKLL